MKKLLMVMGVCLLGTLLQAQTHTFPALDTNNNFTGTNSFAGATNLGGLTTSGSGTPNTGVTPINFAVQNGTSSSYLTTSTGGSPYGSSNCWEGTPTFGAGFGNYCFRFDTETIPSVDVQSGATVGIVRSVKSTNSGGTATDNNTTQVALTLNATNLTTTSSANVAALNVLSGSLYTGASTHTVLGEAVAVSASRAPGWFGDATHDYTVAQTNILQGSAIQDATVAFATGSSTTGKGFLFGGSIASSKQVGWAVLGGQAFPSISFWASQASTYGLFCGTGVTGVLFPTNPGEAPIFANNPPACVAAGPSALTSGHSSNVRWISTDGGGAEHDWDSMSSSDSGWHLKFAGADALVMDPAGDAVLSGAATATKFCMTANLCWTSGAGVPSAGTCAAANGGSLYSRTDGGATTTLYVCDNSTHTWTAK